VHNKQIAEAVDGASD